MSKLSELFSKFSGKNIRVVVNEVDGEDVPVITEAPEAPALFSPEEVTALKALAVAAPAIQNALKDVPAAIQMAQNAQTQAEARKTELVALLKTNQANVFSEDELKGMSINALEKFNAQLTTSYVGAGGGQTITNEGKGLHAPAILLAKEA